MLGVNHRIMEAVYLQQVQSFTNFIQRNYQKHHVSIDFQQFVFDLFSLPANRHQGSVIRNGNSSDRTFR
jgi:hypothetical protein